MEISREICTNTFTDFDVEYRFIKLPIDRYIDIINEPILERIKREGSTPELEKKIITPIAPQYGLVNAINDPAYRFIVAALSRRTGKTFISNLIANLVLFVPGSQILIMSPNYSLSQISWDLQRKFLKDFGIELARANAKDKVLELHNGSTIRMGSISQADSVVGRSYDLILFDECALHDGGEEVFNIQLRPTLDKPNSKAIFISTPRGRNWFYNFYQRGFSDEFPRWVSIHSTVEDNPRAAPEDIEDARKSMSKAEFEQEYYCSFNAVQGLVWNFDRKKCIVEFFKDPSVEWEIIAGLDLGFKDLTACLVIATDGHNFYVIDEYVANRTSTSEHAAAIQKLIDKWDIDFLYVDAAAAQTIYDFASEYEISCVKAKKSILDGVGYVASIVDHNRLFVDSSCEHTLRMLSNYRWDERENLLTQKAVHDEHSHPADALRYAMYSYSESVDSLLY